MRLSQNYPVRGALAIAAIGCPSASAATPFLTITPSIAVRYDSNVARASEAVAEARGLKRSDWRLAPNLNINLEKPVGRQVLYLNGDVGYDFYARNHRLNRGRMLLNGGARLQFSRCTGTLYGSFAARQTDVAELIDVERAGNTEHVTTVGADARCQIANGIAPFVGVSRTWVTNSEARRYADYNMNQANGGIAYSRPVFGELAITASVRDAHYPNRDTTLYLTDHFHMFSIGGRYSRDVGSRLKGSAAINRTTVDSGAGLPKFTGITTDVSLTALVSDNIQAQFSWIRDVKPVNVGFGAFAIDSRLSGGLNYGLSPRLTLSGGGGLIHRHMRGEYPLLDSPELQSERRTYEYASLTYKRSERTSLALDVRHESRSANPSIFNYHSTSVGLVLRTAF